MKWIPALLLSATSALAQPAALTVTPTHPTPGLQLNWTGTAGSVGINRWTDAAPSPVQIATTSGLTYTDSTAVANTIYYYSVVQGSTSNAFPGVVSDLTQSFNCPPMVPVSPSLLGVDRTVSFQSANGSQVTYTISAPNPAVAGANVINVAPCNGAGGCSDYTNINAASSMVTSGGIIQLAAGDYHLTNPSWAGGFNFNIAMTCIDCILAGAPVASGAEPTTRLFFGQGYPAIAAGQVVGLTTSGNRILVRNLTMDWDFATAIPGTINNVDGSHQKFTVSNGAYYVPDPTNPPVIYVLSAYDLVNRVYIQQAGARIGGVSGAGPQGTPQFNTNFGVDGLYYYTLNGGANLPDGTTAVMFVKTRIVFNVGTDSLNTSAENIRIYGGGGPGIIQGPHDVGIRLSNVVIDRKPDALLSIGEQPRLVSLFGDNDSNATMGNILIENSQFGFIDDDTYYMRGNVFQLQTLTSDTGFVMNTASVIINHSPGASDFLLFQDPATYKQIGTMPLATWTHIGSVWTFSFASVPQLDPYFGLSAGNLPVVGEPLWSAPNAFITNVCSHDNHGRIGFLNSNGVLQNSVLANGYFGPVFSVNNNTQPGVSSTVNDGPGGTNIIWRNNKVIGTNYGDTDLQTIWSPSVVSNGYRQTGWMSAAMGVSALSNTGFYAPGYTNANFQIYGNFISNTNGLAILITSANNVGVVNNIVVDANAVPYTSNFNTTLCSGHGCCGANSIGWTANGGGQPWCLDKIPAQGAIMITNSRNVDATSTPNVFLGTSLGLFTDTPTVTKDNIVGSRFIH